MKNQRRFAPTPGRSAPVWVAVITGIGNHVESSPLLGQRAPVIGYIYRAIGGPPNGQKADV